MRIQRRYQQGALTFVSVILLLAGWRAGRPTNASLEGEMKSSPYLEPKAPPIPRITSVDQLMSNVRHIVTRSVPRDQRAGYNLKGGEKVLFVVDSNYDPMVVEAFVKGFKEKNCVVDVLNRDSARDGAEAFGPSAGIRKRILETIGQIRSKDTGLYRLAKEYDVVVGQTYSGPEQSDPIVRFGHEYHWPNRYRLADPAIKFPKDLNVLIDRKSWEIVRQTGKVRFTDVQGTDIRFTWFPEYWMQIEGAYPGEEGSPGFANHIFGPGASENPIIPGHIMAHPRGGEIPEGDLEGVVIGSYGNAGRISEPIKLTYKKSEIQTIERGEEYGKVWDEILKAYDDVKFPRFPRPGNRWLEELTFGTNPKIQGPVDTPELRQQPFYWNFLSNHQGYSRDRTGVVHLGHGARSSQDWADQRGFSTAHLHVHVYFGTYIAETRDGRRVKVLDNGHLTVLDDPEVRQLAARYGNPDVILREDWVPLHDKKTNLIEPPKGKMVSWEEFVQWVPPSLR